MASERLDTLLVSAGYFPTREKARGAIMAGLVLQGPKRLDKPGLKLKQLPDDLIVKGDDCPYVSRGGLKLQKALKVFGIDAADRICLDVGASTGGFTDCLLQHGAQKVFAVDVGHNQLDWKIRTDERVVVLEKVNARHLTPDELYGTEHGPGDKASLAVMDVSFISILKILPALDGLLAADGTLVSLLKPQFEAPQSDNRKGIVSDPKAHARVLKMIQSESPATGWHLHHLDVSPIRGKSGNVEFLGVFYRHPPAREADIEALIRRAHAKPEQSPEPSAATGPSEAESKT